MELTPPWRPLKAAAVVRSLTAASSTCMLVISVPETAQQERQRVLSGPPSSWGISFIFASQLRSKLPPTWLFQIPNVVSEHICLYVWNILSVHIHHFFRQCNNITPCARFSALWSTTWSYTFVSVLVCVPKTDDVNQLLHIYMYIIFINMHSPFISDK